MEIEEQTTQPISDDQELAKVLAGVSQLNDNNLNFEETPIPGTETTPTAIPVTDAPQPVIGYNSPVASQDEDSNNLENIKKDALIELRPLIDKLDLAPEEKFNIYLLLLRSTDDKTLIPSAHAVAQTITDETTRAQALLDIIKEIDYLSSPAQPAN